MAANSELSNKWIRRRLVKRKPARDHEEREQETSDNGCRAEHKRGEIEQHQLGNNSGLVTNRK
jgi:hypothetical protein